MTLRAPNPSPPKVTTEDQVVDALRKADSVELNAFFLITDHPMGEGKQLTCNNLSFRERAALRTQLLEHAATMKDRELLGLWFEVRDLQCGKNLNKK